MHLQEHIFSFNFIMGWNSVYGFCSEHGFSRKPLYPILKEVGVGQLFYTNRPSRVSVTVICFKSLLYFLV